MFSGHSAPPEGDESVAAFMRRKFSPELLEKLVGPFVSGIYAGDPEKLGLRSAFPQIYEAEKSAGSVIRGLLREKRWRSPGERPTLQTFRDGNQTLTDALAARSGIQSAVRHRSAQRPRASGSATADIRSDDAGKRPARNHHYGAADNRYSDFAGCGITTRRGSAIRITADTIRICAGRGCLAWLPENSHAPFARRLRLPGCRARPVCASRNRVEFIAFRRPRTARSCPPHQFSWWRDRSAGSFTL